MLVLVLMLMLMLICADGFGLGRFGFGLGLGLGWVEGGWELMGVWVGLGVRREKGGGCGVVCCVEELGECWGEVLLVVVWCWLVVLLDG